MQLQKFCKNLYHLLENALDKKTENQWLSDNKNRVLNIAQSTYLEAKNINYRADKFFVLDLAREIVKQSRGNFSKESVILVKRFDLTFAQFDMLNLAFCIALLEYLLDNIKACQDEYVSATVKSLIERENIDFDKLRFECLKQEQLLSETTDYQISDTITINYMRKRIGLLAKNSDVSEIEIAKKVKEAPQGALEVLFGREQDYLLLQLGVKEKSKHQKRKLFLVMLALLCAVARAFVWIKIGALFALVSLVPFLMLFYQILAQIFIKNSSPRAEIKLKHELADKKENKTALTLTVMVDSEKQADKCVKTIEEYYCANKIENACYLLLTDLKPAKSFSQKDDENIIKTLKEGIAQLNKKSDNRFCLIVRNRIANSDGYYAYERKRGALKQLSEYITTGKNEFLAVENLQSLENTKYVATFDADTLVPPGTLEELIANIAHPFNKPTIKNGQVIKGSALVAPTVKNTLSGGTRFSNIFSFGGGIDSYSSRGIELYNDVFSSGTYCGKGIFNVECFFEISKQIRDNTTLSHDIIEGELLNATVSSAQVFDEFPKNPISFYKRQERWMRGDWLLLPWLIKKIKPVSKQKIFFNIAKTVAPAGIFLQMLLAPIFNLDAFLIYAIVLIEVFVGVIQLFISSIQNEKEKFARKDNSSAKKITFYKALLSFVFLPYEALLGVKCAIKAMYRRFISHKNILQWSTFSQKGGSKREYYKFFAFSPVAAIITLAISVYFGIGIFINLAIFTLWLFSAEIAYWCGMHEVQREEKLLPSDEEALHLLAMRTVRFFFDALEKNDIMPDNLQLEPYKGYAMRTSPTNIGFALLYPLCAYQLSAFAAGDVLDKILSQLDKNSLLPRYKGHLYNWYDLNTKKPLSQYVSTVDSGNYFSSLMMLCSLSDEIMEERPLSQRRVEGISNALLSIADEASDDYKIFLRDLANEIFNAENPYLRLKEAVNEGFVCNEPWKNFAMAVLKSHLDEFEALSFEQILENKEFERKDLRQLKELLEEYPKRPSEVLMENFEKRLNEALWGINDSQSSKIKEAVLKKHRSIYVFAFSLKSKCEKISRIALDEIENADFSFLYNEKKKLLYIGFDAKTKKASANYYDMLCSEARLTSFLLIALNKISPKNWFALSRPFTRAFNEPMCLSWSGTMFEYLMPDIFIKGSNKSMLYRSSYLAVNQQIEKNKNGIWGISESAFGKLDVSKEYKYKAFGLSACAVGAASEENVFSPYSALLALEYAPQSAMQAVTRFVEEGMAESYGFFEALDLTSARAKRVKTFMAHHSGMSLCALTNFLFAGVLRRMFAKNPCINSAYVLLEEKMPAGILPRTLLPMEKIETRSKEEKIEYSPYSPRECLAMDNDEITTLAFTDGEIKIQKNDVLLLTNVFLFLSGEEVDSIAFEPCANTNTKRKTVFLPGCAEYYSENKIVCANFSTYVCDDNDTVLFDVMLENKTDKPIKRELLFAAEPILQNKADNDAHPCFNGLFIEFEQIDDMLLIRNKKTGLWCGIKGENAHFTSEKEKLFSSGEYAKPDFEFEGFERYPVKAAIGAKVLLDCDNGEKKNFAFVSSFAQTKEEVVKNLSRFSLRAAVVLAKEKAIMRARARQKGSFTLKNKMCALLNTFSRASCDMSVEANEVWRFGIDDSKPLVFICVENELDRVKEVLSVLDMLFCAGVNMEILIAQDTVDDYFCGGFNELESIISSHSLAPKVHHIRKNQLKSVKEIQNLASVYIDATKEINLLCPTKKYGRYKTQVQGVKNNVLDGGEFDNGYGKFLLNENAYYIYRQPPTVWSNILTNERFGCLITSDGGGYSWCDNSRQNKLTPWYNDSVINPLGEAVILRDKATQACRSITKKPINNNEACDVIFYRGAALFRSITLSGEETQTVFVHPEYPIKVTQIETQAQGETELFYFAHAIMGEKENRCVCLEEKFGAACAKRQDKFFFIYSKGAECFFEKDAIKFSNAILQGKIKNEKDANTLCLRKCFNKKTTLFSGYATSEEELKTLIKIIDNADAEAWLAQTKDFWQSKCDKVKIETPSKELNAIFPFLNYQTLASRMLARCGFYQAGGAYGFRDQLQDCLSLILTDPSRVREHILRCSRHQFVQGDVQHWWHEPTWGVRTNISDDLLFLPYVAAKYVLATGDEQIFDEITPYLEGHSLSGRSDVYEKAWESSEKGTLFEHCLRAIKLVLLRFGENGLPLMLAGDWNDGMDKIGSRGKGESVWLGWFLYSVISLFVPFVRKKAPDEAQELIKRAGELARTLNEKCWGGGWFYRAFDDKGRRIGSAEEECCKIDLISQAWSVLSGAGEIERCNVALKNAMDRLVDHEKGMIKLLDPPFDKEYGAGYIGEYIPGVRENGGQYTHAAVWLASAFAQAGQGDKCFEILDMINPIGKSNNLYKCQKYKVEPYVLPADVYVSGRGGWTWYTASSSLYFCAILEDLLGIRQENGQITVKPHIPENWKEYTVEIDTDDIKCNVKVLNPGMHSNSVSRTVKSEKGGVEEIRVIM